MSFRKKLVTTVVVLGLGAVLSSCASEDAPPSNNESNVSQTITTQKATTEKPVASNPGKGIITATKMNSCSTDTGPVTAEGTVIPPANTPGKVVITVSWIDSTNSSVFAQGSQTFKDPEPGKSLDWSIASTLDAESTNVQCVLGATVLP